MSEGSDEWDTTFLGDQLMWTKYLPRAWRSVSGAHSRERFPSWITYLQEPRWGEKSHAVFEAYLHLLLYRLGWVSIGKGLAAWHERGRPALDPVLAFMNRLEGDGLDWFITWAAGWDGIEVPGDIQERRRFRLGGTDELHLAIHAAGPSSPEAETPGEGIRLVPGALVSDTYLGWWKALAVADPAWFDGGVEVTVKPVGWMGTYTRSPTTGLPHATTEEIHLTGYEAERVAFWHGGLGRNRTPGNGPERGAVGGSG